jgi:hypothetical protein
MPHRRRTLAWPSHGASGPRVQRLSAFTPGRGLRRQRAGRPSGPGGCTEASLALASGAWPRPPRVVPSRTK